MKALLITGILAFLAGLGLGYKLQPKQEVKVVEKEVVKNHIKTLVKEVSKPDGTVIKTTKILDKTVHTESKTAVITDTKTKNWRFGVLTDIISPSSDKITLQVERRLIGDFSLVGQIENPLNGGIQGKVGISWEF